MWLPLVVLAIGAIGAGVLNLPFSDDTLVLEHWLEPALYGNEHHLGLAGSDEVILAGVSIAAALGGIVVALLVYLRGKGNRRAIEQPVLAHAWYVDDAYAAVVGGPGEAGFEALATVDRVVVDGAVNGAAALVRGSGTRFRVVQSGFVRAYALIVAFGAVGLLAFFLSRATF
jgi:NADH-quinone oxidoreductase subunit L